MFKIAYKLSLVETYIESSDERFEQDVLAKSQEKPVVVDFWAPWCGPCKVLGPVLEKVIAETKGKVLLVKINVDENPGVSRAFEIQSIPAVYAIYKGQPVSGFVGAIPEKKIREFVNKLLPEKSEAQKLAESAKAMGDALMLRKALELEPSNEFAKDALAEILIDEGNFEEARGLIEGLEKQQEKRSCRLN